MNESSPVGLSLRVRQDAKPEPGGRLGAVWFTHEGRHCGHAIVSRSGRWLVWHELGLFKIASTRRPVVVEGWPVSGSDERGFADRFADEVEPILLQALGYEALHGSGVLFPTGALAICGRSGSGKSTLAYALARKGRVQLADDHLIFDFKDGLPTVVPQAFQPHLRAPSASYFGPATAPSRGTAATDNLTLAACVLLEQVPDLSAPFSIETIAPARAFSAILPNAHCFDPYDPLEAGRLVDHYFAVVHHAPVYAVKYRPSFTFFDSLVSAVEELALLHTQAMCV
jgi:hypothetical protein